MAQPMGMGRLGSADLIFKRQFRWTFELTFCNGKRVPPDFVQLAARPSITIEEQEINFLNGRDWIPSKGYFETINVTYYDVVAADNLPLYNWLATLYDFTDPVNLRMASKRADYSGEANLTLYDGCGNPVENWKLANVWPTSINFGELDMGGTDIMKIELTLRYSQAKYTPLCGGSVAPCACTGC